MPAQHANVITAWLIVCVTSCAAADQHRAAETEVLRADSAWAQAFARGDMATYVSYLDSSATAQAPGLPVFVGLAAVNELARQTRSQREFAGTWYPRAASASRSGDLAVTTGTYRMTWRDSVGTSVVDEGKYVEVWRRHPVKGWQMIIESFNADR